MLPLKALYYRDFNNDHVAEIIEEIYLQKIYQPYLLGKKLETIVDLGSNQGYSVNYFSPYAKTVYAIEPAKLHQETIKKTIETNKLTNVVLCPYAVSNKNETLKFYHSTNTTAHSLERNVMSTNEFEEVEAITFDEFMKRNKLGHIDLLKMDCEGTEGKLLASEGYRQYADKIDVCLGEYHIWSNIEPPQFANMWRDLGFEFNWLSGMKAAVFSAVKL